MKKIILTPKSNSKFAGENRRYLPALFATKKIRGKLLSHDLGHHPLLDIHPLFQHLWKSPTGN